MSALDYFYGNLLSVEPPASIDVPAALSPTGGPLPPEQPNLPLVFRRLIDELCAYEPRGGYHDSDDLRELTLTEIAAVVYCNPDLLAEVRHSLYLEVAKELADDEAARKADEMDSFRARRWAMGRVS